MPRLVPARLRPDRALRRPTTESQAPVRASACGALPRGLLLFTLLLTLAGCSDRDPLAPSPSGSPEIPLRSPARCSPAGGPSLAAAATNLWGTKAPMPTARGYFAAGVVNGTLYALGGLSPQAPSGEAIVASVDAYTPGSNGWTAKASLPEARYSLNGTGTINGVLYVAGGRNTSSGETKTLFAYTPGSNTWATKAPMNIGGACGATGVIAGKLYVYSGCNSADFQRYDPATNSWTTLASPQSRHAWPAVGVIGGKLYLAGGFDATYSAVLEAYDPASNSWTTKAPMPTARWQTAGAVIDGLFYVAGGAGNSGYAGTVEVYDPGSNAWRSKPSMPTVRTGLAGGVVSGVLYALGGRGVSGNALVVTNEAYTAGDVWVVKKSMPTARGFLAAGAVNGVLYALGGLAPNGPAGSATVATVQAYTPGSNSWATRASLPQGRNSLNGTGTIKGVLYVAGGQNASGVATKTLYAYTPGTNTWAAKAPMPAAAACGASGVVNGQLYVYGGACNGLGQPSFQRYNPTTNSWTARPLPATTHTNPAAAVIGGKSTWPGESAAGAACPACSKCTTRRRTLGRQRLRCSPPVTGPPAPPSTVSSTWRVAAGAATTAPWRSMTRAATAGRPKRRCPRGGRTWRPGSWAGSSTPWAATTVWRCSRVARPTRPERGRRGPAGGRPRRPGGGRREQLRMRRPGSNRLAPVGPGPYIRAATLPPLP